MLSFRILLVRLCRRDHRFRRQFFCSSSPSSSSSSPSLLLSKNFRKQEKNSTDFKSIQQLTNVEHNQSSFIHRLRHSRASIIALSASVVSAFFVFDGDDCLVINNGFYETLNWLHKFLNRGKQIAITASVLCHSLRSILSSINQEAKSTFEFRVSALLADIIASNANRRLSIVRAGNGAVLDWLLVRVSMSDDATGTQAESARALAYLISDSNVSKTVMSRPAAIPNLLRFILSSNSGAGSLSDVIKSRSMLVAAIMDIVTTSCDSEPYFSPILPPNAYIEDIEFTIRVIAEGGMHLEDHTNGGKTEISPVLGVNGMWDDLHSKDVALPFAAWAMAAWAMASAVNRKRLLEEDPTGRAVTWCLNSSERTVKWHGSLVAKLLLEDTSSSMDDFVADWCSALLGTLSYASQVRDTPLTRIALGAFSLSMEKSPMARRRVAEGGLPLLREMARRMENDVDIKDALARTLNLLCGVAGFSFPLEEGQRWAGVLLPWIFAGSSDDCLRSNSVSVLSSILETHGPSCVAVSQAWLTLILVQALDLKKKKKIDSHTDSVQNQIDLANRVSAGHIANQLVAAVVNLAGKHVEIVPEAGGGGFPFTGILSMEPFEKPFKNTKGTLPKFNAADSALATLKGVKALNEICIHDTSLQNRVVDLGVLCLLRRLLLCDDYEKLAASETYKASRLEGPVGESMASDGVQVPATAHIRKHAARLLTVLSLLPSVKDVLLADDAWRTWLDDCAQGRIPGCSDPKLQSYAMATLINTLCESEIPHVKIKCPCYDDTIFLVNPKLPHWRCSAEGGGGRHDGDGEPPQLDVVFIHGLRGGPFKTWRIAENKYSTKSGFVEKIDEEAGMQGSFWPGEWLSSDLPGARIFTLKYKSNLTQWSGATLPLQEVSSVLLGKLLAAGIGERPVVFVTHSLGGLVVKQMLFQAMGENIDDIVNNTVGIAFYSCPHFGSKLADVPWRMGLVLRPAPTIGEVRSGSARLVELNNMVRQRHKKKLLEVISFCETKVTPIVEGYGGWAFRMEIVPMESAYPGFGKIVVLESTDHINSCKPIGPDDPSYKELLEFLKSVKAEVTASR